MSSASTSLSNARSATPLLVVWGNGAAQVSRDFFVRHGFDYFGACDEHVELS